MFPEVFSFFFPFDIAKLLLFLCVRKQFGENFANITIKLMYVKCLCACTEENGLSPVLRTPSGIYSDVINIELPQGTRGKLPLVA